jgi:hypothetical protein
MSTTFLESRHSRETCIEIMEAILHVAGGDGDEAARIWEDPSDRELLAIWERVTKNGLRDAREFPWGVTNLGNPMQQRWYKARYPGSDK